MKATWPEASWAQEVAAMDEVDETVAQVRACGPAPLPLDGWDRTSIWGWDKTTGSLYAHLWRNGDDPTKPAIRIEPDGLTPAIKFAATLAQHIAMAVDCDPWDVLTALHQVEDEGTSRDNDEADEAGTVVTMIEGYDIWRSHVSARGGE
jgi:hypothetical protein